MTNGEKYLKDEANILELWENFSDYYYKNKDKESDVAKVFKFFFFEQATPTLTEDEKVILRNLNDSYIKIGRRKNSQNAGLYIVDDCFAEKDFWEYHHLFQFIKDGEEYSIEELLKGEQRWLGNYTAGKKTTNIESTQQ